jgi:hypothetical protein
MTPQEEFRKLAKTKWGRRWCSKAAKALGLYNSTVWRWMQPEAEPPLTALIAMRAICKSAVYRAAKRM